MALDVIVKTKTGPVEGIQSKSSSGKMINV